MSPPRWVRLPSPATVLALLALFVALGGSATAAVLITGGSIKNGTIRGIDVRNGGLTGLDVKNNTLVGGDVRESTLGRVPAATNAVSAQNAANAGTLDGLDSSNLVPGGVIPSGRTVTGAYGALGTADGAGDFRLSTFSFGGSLAVDPSMSLISSGGAPTPSCPGSADDPQAAPGHLCVYERINSNTSFQCPVRVTAPGLVCATQGDPFGAGVGISSSEAGLSYSVGTWAVTAP